MLGNAFYSKQVYEMPTEAFKDGDRPWSFLVKSTPSKSDLFFFNENKLSEGQILVYKCRLKNTVKSGSRTGRKLKAFSYFQGAQVPGVTSRIQGGKEGEWEIWIEIHTLFISCIIANIRWIIEKAR